MQRLPVKRFGDPSLDAEEVKRLAKAYTKPILDLVNEQVALNFAGAYVASLFKNATKCKEIADALSNVPVAVPAP